MEKPTQKEFVKEELIKYGFITRNKCLKNYITRLSDIIFKLKNDGFEFRTQRFESKTPFGTNEDFIYFWTNRPEDKDAETDFKFVWFDQDEERFEVEFTANNFKNACLQFLANVPIFIDQILQFVEAKNGVVYDLGLIEEFKNFKLTTNDKTRI